jgi:hypothetical protein
VKHSASPFDRFARWFDVYRIVPRVALGFYMWQMWRVAEWGMTRADLSTPQTVFVSTVYGAFPFLLNFYMQQGNAWMPAGFTQAQPTTITATATTAPLAKGN